MVLSAKFYQLDAKLDDFLFTEMSQEANGASLSVLSALTRLGVDPWQEGARLAGLPRDVAARELVPMIAMFPKDKRGSAEVQALAERLAALLPQRRSSRMTEIVASSNRRWPDVPRLWLLCVGVLLVLSAMAAFGLLPGQ